MRHGILSEDPRPRSTRSQKFRLRKMIGRLIAAIGRLRDRLRTGRRPAHHVATRTESTGESARGEDLREIRRMVRMQMGGARIGGEGGSPVSPRYGRPTPL